jgi:hypothetical protein
MINASTSTKRERGRRGLVGLTTTEVVFDQAKLLILQTLLRRSKKQHGQEEGDG